MTHWCPKCRAWMDVVFDDHVLSVNDVDVAITGIPLLFCESCKTICLPGQTNHLVTDFVEQAKKNGNTNVSIKPTAVLSKRYPYGKIDFVYSSIDHDFLPGLRRPWDDGFLTPVFFNTSVLNKYSQDPSYTLDLFSNSYGSITKGNEMGIEFGINRAGKVIMWLGDIGQLSESEQFYLRSENVESDHDLCSEFYNAQIDCKFADRSIEHNAVHERAKLNELCKSKLGEELYQLHGEISRVIKNLRRPLFWEEKHVAPAAESFNRIMVESLNVKVLKQQLSAHMTAEKLKGIKGLKLLEYWIEYCLCCNDSKTLTLPFFVLYDLRVLTNHLASDSTQSQMLEAINTRLNLDPNNTDLEKIYFVLLPKIAESLAAISILLK